MSSSSSPSSSSSTLAYKEQFIQASKDGDLATLRCLLSDTRTRALHGVDFKDQSVHGRSAVHWAAQHGHLAVLTELISSRCNVLSRGGRYARTALHFAVTEGHYHIVRQLLLLVATNVKEIVEAKDADGETPLHAAAQTHNLVIVSHLWAEYPAAVHVANFAKTTPLAAAQACPDKNGQKQACVDFLTKAMVMVAPKQQNGVFSLASLGTDFFNVLHWAIKQDFRDAVKAGKLKNHLALALLTRAAEMSAGGTLAHPSFQDLLPMSAAFGQFEVVKALLTRKVNIDGSDSSAGWTALHASAHGGHLAVLNELIACKANLAVVNKAGQTALMLAEQRQQQACIEVLREAFDSKIPLKQQLLDAATRGAIDRVKAVLARKVNIESRGNGEVTALHLAALHGHLDVVTELIAQRADIEAKDGQCYTALHCAAGAGNLHVLSWLLTRGANVDATSDAGCTVLHYAAEAGNLALVSELLTRKANVLVRDNEGKTALALAQDQNQAACADMLQKATTVVEAQAAAEGSASSALLFAQMKEDIEAAKTALANVSLAPQGNVDPSDPRQSKEITYLNQHKHLFHEYYITLQQSFNDAFIVSYVLASNKFALADSTASQALAGLSSLSSGLPFVPMVFSAAQSAASFYNGVQLRGQYSFFAELVPSHNPTHYGSFSERLARKAAISSEAKLQQVIAAATASADHPVSTSSNHQGNQDASLVNKLSAIASFITQNVALFVKDHVSEGTARGLGIGTGQPLSPQKLLAYAHVKELMEFILFGQLARLDPDYDDVNAVCHLLITHALDGSNNGGAPKVSNDLSHRLGTHVTVGGGGLSDRGSSQPLSAGGSTKVVQPLPRPESSPVAATISDYIVKEGAFFKTWKRRFFVLKNSILSWHKSSSVEEREVGETMLGQINLKGYALHADPGGSLTKIRLVGPPGARALVLDFGSKGETSHIHRWKTALNNHIAQANAK